MNFGKKLSTLIKATLRSGLSPSARGTVNQPGDPKAQVKRLQKDLAAVEAKERQVADLLKAAQAKAQSAADSGDLEKAAAQDRLIAELESHLTNQATQTERLTEKLRGMEADLTAQDEELERRRQAAEAAAQQQPAKSMAVGEDSTSPPSEPPPATETPPESSNSDGDPDLSARKSRLSG